MASVSYPYDLGTYSLPVTCNAEAAQVWFDRGLAWTYGYNHEEAIACFRQATEADPDCAMAWWGIAYAAGPNYNLPWHLRDQTGQEESLALAHDATKEALARADLVTPLEADLIRALRARYPQAAPIKDMMPWNHDYADAMRQVLKDHPASLDVRTIAAESLLNLTPWQMWDLATGEPKDGAATLECKGMIEEALQNDPEAMVHAGLLHLYVHLMEMSPTPEVALKAGDALRTLLPDAGHLIHMPTHIDVLVGNYQDVVFWNEAAVRADRLYVQNAGPFNVYSGYRLHNYHFVIYGALFLGQMAPAMRAVRGIRETVPEDLLRIESPPMADYFESYFSFEPHVLVRFGRWKETAEMPLPDDPSLFCTLTANTHYARGVALAALGRVDEAEREADLFQDAWERVPKSRRLHNNRVIHILEIASEMLKGEIAYRKGDFETAFDHLRASVAADDALPYDEPWGWMQPARHALGALLLEQGHVAEAEAVFREDLGLAGSISRASVHPDNIWSLKGLSDCLIARGAEDQQAQLAQRLAIAQARADRAVAASCFCAQAAMKAS